MKHLLPLILISLILSGCSWLRGSPDEPLIGSLKYQPVNVDKRASQTINQQEIKENYRELLRLNPDQRLSSEATRRLADLELDDSESKILQQPEVAAASETIELNSIALYESLLEKDPNYPNRDQVFYQLSRAYELTGNQEKMIHVLDRLVNEHPDSVHWPEAQFRRAERLFVLQQFADAEMAYGAILQHAPNSTYYDRALFKHGWSRFKQQRIEAGLDSFTRLLDHKLQDIPSIDISQLSPADQELLKETLRVISLTFSELGGTQRITQYFNTHGHRDYEFMVYRGLGDLYEKQERIADAADAYLAFVELDPAHPQAPRLSVQIINLYQKNSFPAQALASKKSFTKRYRVQGQYWKQLDSTNQLWLSGQLRTYLKELAEYHHALAQQAAKSSSTKAKLEQKKQGEEAVFWYRRYLDSFPDDPTSGSMSFLMAELLYDLNLYAEAVDAYEKSAYQYPRHKQSAEAGYAALLAYTAEEKRLPEQKRASWQRKAIDSALHFADSFPQDPRTAAVLTQAADQLLALHELDLASQTASKVTAMQPQAKPELRRTAWTVVAHAAFEQNRYTDAEKAYHQALTLLPKKDQSRPELEERLAASIYQQAVNLRNTGDHLAAADQFLRVGKQVPLASIRSTADYDAAASLIAAKDWQLTIKVLEDYRKRYPKSEHTPDIQNKLAVAYLETQQPLKAASEFTALAKQGDNPALRREAGWQAAELYEKGNRLELAINSYKTYVAEFPEPVEQAIEARQKLIELYDKQHKPSERDYWLQEIVKADAKAGKARSDRTRYLAAHATLKLAQPTYERFQHIKLKAPLKKNLKLKKQQMQNAMAAYQKAAQYGVAEVTTAATFRMGSLYQQFGSALIESERPKGLNAEELEQYELLLEEQAYPFEDKAITLYETNTKRASEGIYDEWVRRSFDALAQLLPARYAKFEQSEELIDAIN